MTMVDRELARKRLILALDVPDVAAGEAMLDRVENQVGVVKVGLQLFTAVGPAAVEMVKSRGYDVFLDLKLHDIPNTVAGGVRSARALGVSMLTVHTGGGKAMLERATEEAGDALTVLGVTLLTSMDAPDLGPVGIIPEPQKVVTLRAALAGEVGLGGVVCSPKEVTAVRGALGPKGVIVTPGIRPKGAVMGDQKRAATPASAITDGSNYLVVGRPISGDDNPAAAAARIVDEIAEALG